MGGQLFQTIQRIDLQNGVSSEGRRVLYLGTASDVIISRREGAKSTRFFLEVARDILEWGKSIDQKSK